MTRTTRIEYLKSCGISEKSIENITKSDSNFTPTFVDRHSSPDINFNGHCLIKDNISISKKVINIYVSYSFGPQLRDFNTYFKLSNCLFLYVKLVKNAYLNKYKYTGYGIGFDSRREYSLPDGRVGKNVIIFGVDMSSYVHIDNKRKDILILGKGATQGLDGTTFTAEALYPINFEQSGKRFVLSPHCNGSNCFLSVSATKIHQFKAKKLLNKGLYNVLRKCFKRFYN